MDRRHFNRVADGGIVTAAASLGATGCSDAYPPQAVQAWQGPPADEPDVRRWLLGYAILAPHSHNLQSWLVDLRTPGEILLHCDLTRLLPETDPFSRQIMMSHGTFLELLDLAARQRGLRADIELFPQGEFAPSGPDRRPVARIRLAPDARVRPDPLFTQILARRTNREAYEAREPAAAAVRAVIDSVAPHRARAGFTAGGDAQALARHRAIASEAWRIELETPRTILESYKVLRVGPGEIAPAPGDAAIAGQIKDFNAKIGATPAFFWLVTQGNDRKTQVDAGRAYARAQLAATAHGLAMQPLSQALQEYPEQAATYAAIHTLLGAPAPGHTVQMWARMGYAPAVQPAPRRGVDAHLMGA